MYDEDLLPRLRLVRKDAGAFLASKTHVALRRKRPRAFDHVFDPVGHCVGNRSHYCQLKTIRSNCDPVIGRTA